MILSWRPLPAALPVWKMIRATCEKWLNSVLIILNLTKHNSDPEFDLFLISQFFSDFLTIEIFSDWLFVCVWWGLFFIFLLLFFSSLQEPEGHVEVRVRHADWKLNAVCAASVAGKHSCCYHGYCHLRWCHRWCHTEVLILFWRKQLIISASIFCPQQLLHLWERPNHSTTSKVAYFKRKYAEEEDLHGSLHGYLQKKVRTLLFSHFDTIQVKHDLSVGRCEAIWITVLAYVSVSILALHGGKCWVSLKSQPLNKMFVAKDQFNATMIQNVNL